MSKRTEGPGRQRAGGVMVVCAVVVGVGCTPAASTTSDGGQLECIPAVDAGGSSSVAVGAFEVKLRLPTLAADGGVRTAGSTQVLGTVYDAPQPVTTQWTTSATKGDCKLLVPHVPFCSTDCCGSSACVGADTCQAYPTQQAVGEVAVSGVHTADGGTLFTMKPVVNGYQSTVKLAYPPFAENEVVQVGSGGGTYGAFTLTARGIAPLEFTSHGLVLTGASLGLTWTPATTGDSRVFVKVDISHHGGTKGKIECDTADDGSLTIDASLMSSLLSLGVAGYPSVIVTRASVGSTMLPHGRVDLSVDSEIEEFVQVPGVVSCSSSAECDGGTCRADLTCG